MPGGLAWAGMCGHVVQHLTCNGSVSDGQVNGRADVLVVPKPSRSTNHPRPECSMALNGHRIEASEGRDRRGWWVER